MEKYLICVDSDGCAMDTMTIKHEKCFGPMLIKQWKLDQWKDDIQKRWNDINLYTKNRGINRFHGLYLMLAEINDKYTPIEGVEILGQWVETTKAFSEAALKEAIDANPEAVILQKALAWSQDVNSSIQLLSDDDKVAFSGVKEALAKVKEVADLAIVSSANREAMEEEWVRCEIMQYVDVSMAQDVGSKAACIKKMISEGYAPEKILMVGDAEGDHKAAVAAGVMYYPILAGKEVESWEKFKNQVLDEFVTGNYSVKREEEELALFDANLK